MGESNQQNDKRARSPRVENDTAPDAAENNEIIQSLIAEDEREPAWSWMGFEFFDLIVIGCQALFFLLAWPMDWFFLHPAVKSLGAAGFLICLFYLGRTRQYTIGYSRIGGIHEYLHVALLLGGFFAGLMLCVPILAPLSQIDSGWMKDLLMIAGIALGLFAACLIPYMAARAAEPDSTTRFFDCPNWVHTLGRGFTLIIANTMLIHVCQSAPSMDEDLFMRFVLIGFLMCATYIPIRVQEMFLRPSGPHFQSLIQTLIILVVFGTVGI